MVLPTDSHVHSEWSWDAQNGSMECTCERAVRMGLPAVVFTEHLDFTAWQVMDPHLDENAHLAALAAPDGTLTPARLDLAGYLVCIERCREKFPNLRIITGVELGEPHLHGDLAAGLLDAGRFERVLGSLHCLPEGEQFSEPPLLYRQRQAAEVMRAYLSELATVIACSDAFAVLAHIDYPVRSWPAHTGPFDPYAFESEFRHALATLADSGRALEVNTRVPLHAEIVAWWRDEGGEAITFGSDAHDPTALARGFVDAAAMVEAQGFRPGRHPYDFWICSPTMR